MRYKKAFTLVEIMVVLVIMGFITTLVAPRYAGVTEGAKYNMNTAQMQRIKAASLAFYKDVGFVPDSVSLLVYPYEKCDVNDSNWDLDGSDICKSMIAFIDSHYKFDDSVRIEDGTEGDNGKDTVRKPGLIDIIREKLDPKRGGWHGSYIGGNGILRAKNIKMLGDGSDEDTNMYYFSDQDIKIYYDGFDKDDTLYVVDSDWDADRANRRLYPVISADFNGSRGSGHLISMDLLYENAKYRNEMNGSVTILDSFGTPFEIQIPTKKALEDAVSAGIIDSTLRTRYARIVSFGANRRRDTPVDVLDIDYHAEGYDDSVLYIFENELSSYFHPKDKE